VAGGVGAAQPPAPGPAGRVTTEGMRRMKTSTATLTRHGRVFELDLGDGQNRFTPDGLARLEELLTAASEQGAAALVTTSSGRFFSTGLDLGWLLDNPGEVTALVDAMHRLFARFLSLPMSTTAVIDGHAIGGGAMLALCHDHTVAGPRATWSLPEVRLPLAFTPGLLALVRSRLPPDVAVEAVTTGRQYDQAAAVAAGIATRPARDESAHAAGYRRATELADVDAVTVGVIRGRLFADVIAALQDGQRNRSTAADFTHLARQR
jgi:enoyl-CoA hydratase/carnithine racemase